MKTTQLVKLSSIFSVLMFGLSSPLLFAGEDAPHWSYEGEEGPDHWGELAEEYRACSGGANQSPIDISGEVHSDLPELVFEYYSNPVSDINNGHTIQQNIQPGSFLRIPRRDRSFELKQFHFHSPSEHTVHGEPFAMELHFVHADENGALAVVGILIEEGEENPIVSKLNGFQPDSARQDNVEPVAFEESGLLPSTRDYYAYGGSLTTPPCSEGVKWIVLKRTIEVSAEQIAIFKQRVGLVTNRPVQPHNARIILD